jgi:hypothetical protein
MDMEAKLDQLEKDFTLCRESIGLKMLSLEKDSIEKLTRLEVETSNISSRLASFVSQHEFAPVKLITYGIAAGVGMTVLGAVLAKSLGL